MTNERSVEPVRIVYSAGSPGGPRTHLTPVLAPRPFIARQTYINSCTGLSLTRPEMVALLRKMGHDAFIPLPSSTFHAINLTSENHLNAEDLIHVLVPPTRPDILHECDIMEDVAVAYGFNNLKRTFPSTSTVAKPFPLNKLTDTMRRLCSEAGWIEVLPLILVRPFPSSAANLGINKTSARTMKTLVSSIEWTTVLPLSYSPTQKLSSTKSCAPPFSPVSSKRSGKIESMRSHSKFSK